VRATFVSKQSIAAGGLPAPFAQQRPLGSALYFMVTPGAPAAKYPAVAGELRAIAASAEQV